MRVLTPEKIKRLFLLMCCCLLMPSQSGFADPLDRVTSASPSWKGFTNKDGTGLYHDILTAVFSPLNIEVVHKYTNAKRGIYLVKNNMADIYTCIDNINVPDGLVLGRFQMYEGRVFTLFKKKAVKEWQGIASLSQKKVVWRRGYYSPMEFGVDLIPVETDSGISALAQVILGRCDFYVDDLNLINASIAGSLFPVDNLAFRIEPVGSRTYHPAFAPSDRGKNIIAIYEAGMKRLIRSGKLKKIFEKWDHALPDYPPL